VNAAPHWNKYEIISNNGHLTLIQNGHKVSETELWDDHWRDMIKNSKFTEWPGFGTFQKGHILSREQRTGSFGIGILRSGNCEW
jgi:hypothetical protein